jgi:CRISPR/Cas system CSM-associated protein Csm3 (group 7 of RAMP superfamily)
VIIHLYQLCLTLTTPGAVSAPEAAKPGTVTTTSLPLARDAAGAPYIPATSVAGALRAHARNQGGDLDTHLFGDVHQEPDPQDRRRQRTVATASPVRFLGTRAALPPVHHGEGQDEHHNERANDGTLRRTHTAIDRHRAAAVPRTLHSRDLLPPGTTITVWLRLDSPTADPPQAATLERLLATWRPTIGGARSTGNGRAQLTALTRKILDLSSPGDRHHWLTHGGPALFQGAQPVPGFDATTAATPSLLYGRTFTFTIADALHIGTGTRGHGERRTTKRALQLRDHDGHPLIPGSTWKGLLRSRCEFILRSLSQPACPPSLGPGAPAACGTCRICTAFGHTRASGDSQDNANADSVGLRGRLIFLDSPVDEAVTVSRNHVALDRVFGGASDKLLFTEEVVEQGRLDLAVLDEPPAAHGHRDAPDPVLTDVLLLALYDLHTGALGVGTGTTRGYGTLQADTDTAAYLDAHAPAARARLAETLLASHHTTGKDETP